MTVRVRFAPSPTGQLHLGGLRTALYNYLFARQHEGGKIVLRIEDTDRSRLVPGAAESINETLKWCGINFDESPFIKPSSDYGPYTQSERTELYRSYARKLLKDGHAYRCFCKPERLSALRQQYQLAGRPFIYDRYCSRLSDGETQRRMQIGEPHVVRMRIPITSTNHSASIASSSDIKNSFATRTALDDLVYGEVEFKNRLLDDQILLKSDGQPTYHLASVVDDYSMQITHVIRGEEWLSSTPKHLLLYQQLGWKPPKFAHLPLLVNADDKSKLSKRQNDAHVSWYRSEGWLPEGLINYVALLGWAPTATISSDSVMTMDDLITKFSLNGVSKNSAAVSPDRLQWFNKQHIQRLYDDGDGRDRLLKMLNEKVSTLEGVHSDATDLNYQQRVLQVMRSRISNIHELTDTLIGRHYFLNQVSWESKDARQMLIRSKCDAKQVSALLSEALKDITGFAQENNADSVVRWSEWLEKFIASQSSMNSKRVKLLLRYALTGYGIGAGLPETMWALGRRRVAERLSECSINCDRIYSFPFIIQLAFIVILSIIHTAFEFNLIQTHPSVR